MKTKKSKFELTADRTRYADGYVGCTKSQYADLLAFKEGNFVVTEPNGKKLKVVCNVPATFITKLKYEPAANNEVSINYTAAVEAYKEYKILKEKAEVEDEKRKSQSEEE